MKGDFSRWSFNPARHFSAVLMQQGRVMLDADHNEQAAIFLHALRTLTRDLFGAHGGPAGGGFSIAPVQASGGGWRLWLSPGHYYVDGLLCECEAPGHTYDEQPDHKPAADDALMRWLHNPAVGQAFWLYLDVWERHVSWVEDDSIREVALGGPDTCSRSQVVWQLKALPWKSEWEKVTDPCSAPLESLRRSALPTLAARLDPGLLPADPCVLAPDARYRGAENQLYRVEVHRGGTVGVSPPPTFKWSRDNGSTATTWLGTEGHDLIVGPTRGFEGAVWVELLDDDDEREGRPGLLVQVASVGSDRLAIEPASIPSGGLPAPDDSLHPRVRRWDQQADDLTTLDGGAVPVAEGDVAGAWGIALEDGVQVRFGSGGQYRTGDYWLIPARVATGSIDWPVDAGSLPRALPPLGVQHFYAPLGVVARDDSAGKPVAVIRKCQHCAGPLPPLTCPDPDTSLFSGAKGQAPAAGASAPPAKATPAAKPQPARRSPAGGTPRKG